jgi:2'-deoxynucleoside 5'-phosphate N-hydrolase
MIKQLVIYFAGSIRAGRDDAEIYKQIIHYLRRYGTVLTEHVGDSNIETGGETVLTDRQIHDRDCDWLMQANVVVAEVTTPSLGVGYEIGRAVENGKQILCLFRPDSGRNLSAMIAGCPEVVTAHYHDVSDAIQTIDAFFRSCVGH